MPCTETSVIISTIYFINGSIDNNMDVKHISTLCYQPHFGPEFIKHKIYPKATPLNLRCLYMLSHIVLNQYQRTQ